VNRDERREAPGLAARALAHGRRTTPDSPTDAELSLSMVAVA
jgi:hypothetical protein